LKNVIFDEKVKKVMLWGVPQKGSKIVIFAPPAKSGVSEGPPTTWVGPAETGGPKSGQNRPFLGYPILGPKSRFLAYDEK